MKRAMVPLLLLVTRGLLFSQVATLSIGDNKPEPLSSYQVVVSANAPQPTRKAASELVKYLHRITGVSLPVVDEQAKMRPHEIIIGTDPRTYAEPGQSSPDPDGFIIRMHGTVIRIFGGTHKGTLYGVYAFLQRYCGCRFLTPSDETVPAVGNLVFPETDLRENPAFYSREVYYAGMADDDFADKMHCDRHAWKRQGDWGLWVHTMFTLVPPEKYFEPHPEYYALMAGKRQKTQLCLTNPEVLKITIGSLRQKIKEMPDANYWSVSQMDTYGSCECDRCRTIDEEEGSASGSLIWFVNKVAAAFPDKIISTLAYQYTRKAPLHIKPASNVNIMLCTIECDRSRPLESDTARGSFLRDLQSWSKIAEDILVWDYVIQFTHMIGPFPNMAVLQPNIRMFKNYGAGSVFEQGCHGTYSENQELRQYLLSKLLWNPSLDFDSLVNGFLHDYYGNAGPWIRNYLDEMETNLQNSGKELWIYGSPVQETGSFLSPEQVDRYRAYFVQAEAAVRGDSALAARVEKARLPVDYAIIESARRNITGEYGFLEKTGNMWQVRPGFMKNLDAFVGRCNLYDVKTLHERTKTPEDYRKEVENSLSGAYTDHLAIGKTYVLTYPPSPKYMADGSSSLADGKRGFDNYFILWQGFEGKDFEITIDLGVQTMISSVSVDFLRDITSWIFWPEKKILFSASMDGVKFFPLPGNYRETDTDKIKTAGTTFDPENARYVRVFAKSIITVPEWHIGHGGKAWLFVDEVVVK